MAASAALAQPSLQWPDGDMDFGEFLSSILNDITTKGYVTISMPPVENQEGMIVSTMESSPTWELPEKAEFEAAYLGRGNNTKFFHIGEGGGLDESLATVDSLITDLTMLMAPYTDDCFGFSSWGRMAGMFRVKADQKELEDMQKPGLSEDTNENNLEHILDHLHFLERRRLCFIYMLKGQSKVDLMLDPLETVDVAENQLLVFRHDQFAYQFFPDESSAALQTWILCEPWEPEAEFEQLCELPEHMEKEPRDSIIAAHMRTAGSVFAIEPFWCGFVNGLDGQVQIPSSRWDHSKYYVPLDDTDYHANRPTTYCKHGAFVDHDDLEKFDPRFFGIPEEEMPDVAPGQRFVLNTGYETLALAGFTKESVRGKCIGNFVGDSQSDWINLAMDAEITPTCYTGASNSITAMRGPYCLGLTGPAVHIDTACSSSLVALDRAHMAIKKFPGEFITIGNNSCKQALVTGLSLVLDPHLYVGYAGAQMLSKKGRCFTFDGSADGFARGEGSACVFVQHGDAEKGYPEMLAALVGSFTNQDGRSATMTAPNGPSQTAATRSSLKQSGFEARDVSACECHGTGTPLGDPIEYKALKEAFMRMEDHPAPMPFTSAKTNVGHNEANAGLAGVVKCLLMLVACSTPPNNHMRVLNEHMDVHGAPCLFGNEVYDFGCAWDPQKPAEQQGKKVNQGLMGVSSFGSGGTNARADLWGRCMIGAQKTMGLSDGTDLERKRGFWFNRIENDGRPGPTPKDRLSIIGTWDAWSASVPMTLVEGLQGRGMASMTATYQASIELGETQCEQFYIIVDDDREQSIHPVTGMGGPDTSIVGPDAEGTGHAWKIDGKADEAPPGTTYTITFRWSFEWERGEKKAISWTRTENPVETDAYNHAYYVNASWTGWTNYKMLPRTKKDGEIIEGIYFMTARIGNSDQEEFHIVRDRDATQMIYPAMNRPTRTTVPVRGPDEHGSGKNFMLRGPSGSKVEVVLNMKNIGNIKVTVNIEKIKSRTWESSDKDDWHDFYIAGSWNDWGLSTMTPDHAGSSVYRLNRDVILGKSGFEEFRIIRDKDWDQALYPLWGEVCGPDGGGQGCNWTIQGEPGDEYEIVLDTSGERPSVTWNRTV